MVDNVELNDTVEQLTTNEAKIPVDSGQSTLLEGPGALLKVLSIAMVVVKVSDGNCSLLVTSSIENIVERIILPSQWLTQR